jgi:type II secretory pathway pseudopilin PulG
MSWLRRLRSNQSGFTLIAVVTGMTLISMFALGAYSSAIGDISIGRKDQDHKRAQEAAKAGIEWYTYHLLRDPNYWTNCDDASKIVTPGVSLQGMNRPAGAWRTLSNSTAKFQVELMTADGLPMTQAQCLADPGGKMLNGGVLKVRSTGQANGKQRQYVASFRRNTFLDYLWYTGEETQPPQAYDASDIPANGNPGVDCAKARNIRPSWCSAIQFAAADAMKGPMHTEDSSFLVCDSPTFGRTKADSLEVTAAASTATAYVAASGCGNSPNLQGNTVAPAKSLDLPPSNASLENVATILASGKTCLVFSGNSVTVRRGMTWSGSIDCTTGGTPQTYTLGADTVIYVKNDPAGVCGTYQHLQQYNESNYCGDVAVSGSYGQNVTIGAANDIIVNANLNKSGNAMMGLIAQNFVRVYHPGTWSNGACVTGTSSNTVRVSHIDASILALNSAFIADNWDCGNSLGNLTVLGTIAQRWRGAVGVGQGNHGYLKDYQYDDRLKYREPPEYLDPAKASWHLLRQSEQSPVK